MPLTPPSAPSRPHQVLKDPGEDELEACCKLFTTVGKQLESESESMRSFISVAFDQLKAEGVL
jgi:hypothetical protein